MKSRAHLAGATILLALDAAPSPAAAHRDDYLGGTFVFETVQSGEVELEVRELTVPPAPKALFVHEPSFEAGLTDRFMVEARALFAAPAGEGEAYRGALAEARYRFGEEGEYPIDIATSLEVEEEHDSGGHGLVLEPTGVLSKDFLGANATLDVSLVTPVVNAEWAVRWALAARSPRWGERVALAIELIGRVPFEGKPDPRDALPPFEMPGRTPALFPAVHVFFGEVSLKAGAGFDTGDPSLWFVLAQIEVEIGEAEGEED